MKKFILVFFITLLFFFIVNKSFIIYAQDVKVPLPPLTEETINTIKEVITGKTDEEKKKEAERVEAENKKLLDDYIQERATTRKCDSPGTKCCFNKELSQSEIPLQSKIIDKDTQRNLDDKPDDPFSPVWCGYHDLQPLIPSSLDPQSCTCTLPETKLEKLCERVSSPSEERACLSCSNSNIHDQGVWTALGCVDSTLAGFIKNTLLGWGIGLAGILAMLCIIYSAFVLQISSGNPEKIKKAKERLTACVVGLLLIIFSVFILKLIGVDILQIPWFGI